MLLRKRADIQPASCGAGACSRLNAVGIVQEHGAENNSRDSAPCKPWVRSIDGRSAGSSAQRRGRAPYMGDELLLPLLTAEPGG